MFFRKKDRLKKQFDTKLMEATESCKSRWTKQKYLVEKSLEPSEEVICQLKMAEAKYLFLLREVRTRMVGK
ncbi:YaaL family protein [Sutcliffiella deserti]|uniref:YaaL family protein n=1 Tax=Sutcliffiella deserti TaxID=2875501 RepID=UPI001CBFFEAE|nr:YaaL family protein [Sutcliffiella deserti]